jgi:ribosome-binding protein aMBF1 (putative translation factor)
MNDLTRDDLWNLLRLAEDYAEYVGEEGEEEHAAYTTLATKIYAVIRKMEDVK